jgi:hypothetical protein
MDTSSSLMDGSDGSMAGGPLGQIRGMEVGGDNDG